MLQRAGKSWDWCLKNGKWDEFSNYPVGFVLRGGARANGPLI